MIDPADQRASDEAIRRNTNLTPTGVRQALQETASDFQRRVDAQGSTTPVDSIPKQVGQITTTQTTLKGDPVALTAQNDNQNPFPKNSTGFDGPGTSSNPYVMGTNSSTKANLAFAQDDTCTLVNGVWVPNDPTGGPYDAVIFGPNPTGGVTRFFVDNANAVQREVVLDAGGTTLITSTPVRVYTRALTLNSLGQLIFIAEEEGPDPGISLVTMT